MEKLCRALAPLEEAIIALERRGIALKIHAIRQDPVSGKMPVFRLVLGREDHWFITKKELEQFLEGRGLTSEGESTEAESTEAPAEDDAETDDKPEETADPDLIPHITELHEVRTINIHLAELTELGFDIQALIPQERTGSTESRFKLLRGENETGLEDLRALLPAVRSAGEKGLQVTRFKGLGEMNAEELRETTLDPQNRTLLQVTMTDASAADDMFRILMGDKVEPRREFIEKHALDVRNLDV